MITAEGWDTHEYRILNDLRGQGVAEDNARAIADIETTEQFGARPAEETT